ncbi:hypothetical protein KY284_030407 [Solanum tuberosum]|nr:hypothetical protein KY284_030407 [Solanum tuberosum]
MPLDGAGMVEEEAANVWLGSHPAPMRLLSSGFRARSMRDLIPHQCSLNPLFHERDECSLTLFSKYEGPYPAPMRPQPSETETALQNHIVENIINCIV